MMLLSVLMSDNMTGCSLCFRDLLKAVKDSVRLCFD